MLYDRMNRSIGYLRLSITQACQLRCIYCRPALHQNHTDGMLTPAEFGQIAHHFILHHGVQKIRITGGDPTARGDLPEIIGTIATGHSDIDLAMSTNGLALGRLAATCKASGLKRVNISMDTLDESTFERLSGRRGVGQVIAGIDAAIAANLAPVKLNMVVMRGINDGQLASMVDFAAQRNITLRFIELMPMGPLAPNWHQHYAPAASIRRSLEPLTLSWRPLEQGAESSRNFRVVLRDGREVSLGFITPMSCNFCGNCNRLRISCTGDIFPCLMNRPRGTLLPALRPKYDPLRFDALLAEALAAKEAEHPHDGFAVMTSIGG